MMLYTYSLDEQTINTNSTVALNINGIKNSYDGITHVAGTPTITINRAGIYIIAVNLDATSATVGTQQFALYNNGAAVKGALATSTIATANDINNYNFVAAIKVLPSCPTTDNIAQLTIVNTGENAAIISNAAVTVRPL